MIDRRFIALIASEPRARSVWEQATGAALTASANLEKQLVGDRFAFVAAAGGSVRLGDEGVILGALHERGRTGCVAMLEPSATRAIADSRGARLISGYWGGYVACIAPRDRDDIEVVRAPLGDLACFIMQSDHGLLLASDVGMLQDFAGYTPRIDWPALARHLAASALSGRKTCLEGVDELAGGERLTDHCGHRSITQIWRLWDFTRADHRLTDPEDAAYQVRNAVLTAVAGRATPFAKLVLRLSGGLDSSIVAAALAHAGKPFAALNMVTRDRAGDERRHARAVAEHVGVDLVEALRKPAAVDLETSLAAGWPRPSQPAFSQATLRAADRLAGTFGADAIVDGGGGDHVFASLQSTAPIVDCLYGDGAPGSFWKTARSLGVASGTGTLHAARRALWRRLTRGPAFRWPVDLTMLSPLGRTMAKGAAAHPWLQPPPGALPGSGAHIALLAGAQTIVHSVDPRRTVPLISPLVSQPVAEACLRVPSWLWTEDGQDRAIARAAFAKLLPPAILRRRGKGAPDSFLFELIDANRAVIRAMLTDGLLASHGLLDLADVHAALAPARLAKGFGYTRIMQLVDAEAWARSWG